MPFTLTRKRLKGPVSGFISYKSMPDLESAQAVASQLQRQGLNINFISGDSLCPHPQGSKQAEAWITNLLDAQTSPALISIASQEAMRSKWVLHEFWRGLSTSSLIFLLWMNGPDPTSRYFPFSRRLARWIPTPATTYLIDCRGHLEEGVDVVEQSMSQFPKIRRNRTLRRFVTLLVMLALLVLPFWFFLWIGDSPDLSEKYAYLDTLKGLSRVWILFLMTALFFVYPSHYKLPSPLPGDLHIERITSGFTSGRWSFCAFLLIILFTGIRLGAIQSGILAAVIAVSIEFLGKAILSRMVKRSYAQADLD